MKTRSKFWGIALATLLMAGCQDDTNISDNSSDLPGTANGYVKVSINMPSTVGTRATGSYDDGTANEYKVNNAYILFFNGTDEATATFLGAYDMNLSMNGDNTNSDQITTTSDAYIMEAPIGTESALVIINPDKNLLVLDANTHILSINSTDLTTASKLEDLQKALIADVATFIGENKDNFTMTNAPLSNLSGQNLSDAGIEAATLAAVNVHESRTQAEAAAADQIYVERVVAKVSMDVKKDILDNQAEEGKTVIMVDAGLYQNDKVELEGWVLNVTNKNTKLVRDVTGFTNWITYTPNASRFVDNSPVKQNAGKFRINWAVDCNYNAATPETDFNTYTTEPTWNTTWTTEAGADYCLENTFTTGQMKQDRTTQVLIKTTYRFSNTDKENFIVVENWNSGAISVDDFIERLKKDVTGLADATIELKADAAGGYYNKTGYKMLSDLLTVDGSTADLNAVIEAVGTVKFYKNGASYYSTALIRHFDNSETSWSDGEEYDEGKHLGRYGVVRNTWYQLTINSIAGPGEPEIPEIPDTPDDEQEAYIKVQVNILAWAVRQNDINL